MHFPPACRRKRRFTHKLLKMAAPVLIPDISILTLLWVDSQRRGEVAMRWNKTIPLVTVAGIWKDHISDDTPKPTTSLCSGVKACATLSTGDQVFDDTLTNVIFFLRTLPNKNGSLNVQTWRDSCHLGIADMSAVCFHPPMAPSPLKSSHHKWIDLAL